MTKLAKDILNDLFENFEMIDKQLKRLTLKMQSVDKALSGVKHDLEKAHLNNVTASDYAFKMQTLLQERRVIKEEIEALTRAKEFLPIGMNTDERDYFNRKKGITSMLEKYTNYDSDYFKHFAIDPKKIVS